jgi:hypothetical protein
MNVGNPIYSLLPLTKPEPFLHGILKAEYQHINLRCLLHFAAGINI